MLSVSPPVSPSVVASTLMTQKPSVIAGTLPAGSVSSDRNVMISPLSLWICRRRRRPAPAM